MRESTRSVAVTAGMLACCVLLPGGAAGELQWTHAVLDTGGVGDWSSMALDALGDVHVAHRGPTGIGLKYGEYRSLIPLTEVQWGPGSHGVEYGNGWYASLDLDTLGNPHICHYNRSTGELAYEWYGIADGDTQAGWHHETVYMSQNPFYGSSGCSIALDSNDTPYIVFHDQPNHAVIFLTRDATGTWGAPEMVDNVGDVGWYVKLALGMGGTPHISYYARGSALHVKHAARIGSSWVTEVVDSTGGNSGFYSSIVVGPNGDIHIAYTDDTVDRDLLYARKAGASWVLETVDTAGLVGRDSSIAVDVHGTVHVSYHDQTVASDCALKYAARDAAGWGTPQVIERGPGTGGYTSLDVDPHGTVHITYKHGNDPSTMELHYAVGAPLNHDPLVDAGGPYPVDEGGSAQVTATGTDSDGDSLTFTWDFDGDGDFDDATGATASYSAADDDGPTEITIAVKADDGKDGIATDDATVNVANVAPTIASLTARLEPVPVGTAVTATGEFTDPCPADTHTATWDWGDDTVVGGTVTGSSGIGTVSDQHTYQTPGVYPVALTVTDDDGGDAEAVFEFVVVYDPSGGFVTGGGWITSLAGALVEAPALTGKANFGFNSKYKKGASEPTGQTQFQFKVADLNFHSSSYQWLVVAGEKAKYKGDGTINGGGDFGFMLTAVDGDAKDPAGPDTFRIKIWDKADNDAVVYDNKIGDGDDSYTGTELGGGNIVVHDGTVGSSGLGDDSGGIVTSASAMPTAMGGEIAFTLSGDANVSVSIVNLAGRPVRRLATHRPAQSGMNSLAWNGCSDSGLKVPAGCYLVTISAKGPGGSANRAIAPLSLGR